MATWTDRPKSWDAYPNDHAAKEWQDLTVQMANKYGVPPELALGILLRGEATDADKVSSTGAKGVFQFIPGTVKRFQENYNIDPLASPEAHAESAVLHLKESLDRHADLPPEEAMWLAAAEYAGGTDWQTKKQYKLPGGKTYDYNPENTKSYANNVTSGFVASMPQGADKTLQQRLSDVRQRAAQRRASASTDDSPESIDAYGLYSEGKLTPEQRAEYENGIKSGTMKLPSGVTKLEFGVFAPKKKQEDAPREALASALVRYTAGVNNDARIADRFTDEQMMRFEQRVREGKITVPEGFSLRQTEAPGTIATFWEKVSGKKRATPETEDLPSYSQMPEITGEGTLRAVMLSMDTDEMVREIKKRNPGVTSRKDKRGNYILKSPETNQEYAIPPGFDPMDLLRVAAPVALSLGGAAAAPVIGSGAVGSILTGAAAGLAGQGAIEGTRAALGMEQPTGDVAERMAISGALGAAIPGGGALYRAARSSTPAGRVAAQEAVQIAAPAAATRSLVPEVEAATQSLAPEFTYVPRTVPAPVEMAPYPTVPAPVRMQPLATPAPVEIAGVPSPVDMAPIRAPAAVEMAPYPTVPAPVRMAPVEMAPIEAPAAKAAGPSVPPISRTIEKIVNEPEAVIEAADIMPAPTAAAQQGIETTSDEMRSLIVKAANKNKKAQAGLAKAYNIDQKSVESAARLDLLDYMPPDYFSADQALRQTMQAVRSVTGSRAKDAAEQALAAALNKFESTMAKFGAKADIQQFSDDVKSVLSAQQDKLDEAAEGLYSSIRSTGAKAAVSPDRTIGFLRKKLSEMNNDVSQLSDMEKDILERLATKSDLDGLSGYSFEAKELPPTYTILDFVRKDIGEMLSKNKGKFKDSDVGLAKALYETLLDDQQAAAESFGMLKEFDAARGIVRGRKAIDDNMRVLFTKTLDKELVSPMIRATAALARGEASEYAALVNAMPKNMRRDFIGTSLTTVFGNPMTQTAKLTNYIKWYEGIRKNKSAMAKMLAPLDEAGRADLRQSMDDMYNVSKSFYGSSKEFIGTGKISSSKEALEAVMKPKGVIANAFNAAAGAAYGFAYGRLQGNIFGSVGAAIFRRFANRPQDIMAKVDELLMDKNFIKLAFQQAADQVDEKTLKMVAGGGRFKRFAESVRGVPMTFEERQQFLTSLLSAGAPQAARVGGRAPAGPPERKRTSQQAFMGQ